MAPRVRAHPAAISGKTAVLPADRGGSCPAVSGSGSSPVLPPAFKGPSSMAGGASSSALPGSGTPGPPFFSVTAARRSRSVPASSLVGSMVATSQRYPGSGAPAEGRWL